MLTKEKFDKFPPNYIFSEGSVPNSPEGIYMTNNNLNKDLYWVAKTGCGEDWTIYITWYDEMWKHGAGQADKVTIKDNILKLVPCTEEVYNRYRH
jgi:hypothetical protein